MATEDKVLQITKEDLNKEIKKTEKLKKAANRFLNHVVTVVNQQLSIEDRLKRFRFISGGTQDNLISIYHTMEESLSVTRECLNSQILFQEALNEFLDREINMAYVTEDGEILYANKILLQKIYATAQRAEGGIGDITLSKQMRDKLLAFPKNIPEQYKNTIKNRQEKYKPIRNAVIERWQKNHNLKDKQSKLEGWLIDKTKQDTFFWVQDENAKQIDRHYGFSKKMNRGHINEAYVSLVWQSKNEEDGIKLNEDIENSIKKYWDYMDRKSILNSKAGVVGGDVSFYQNALFQLAVKSGDFSTAAMGPYLDVAYQIAYGKQIAVTKENVNELLENLTTYSNLVRNYGLKKAQQSLKQLIQNKDLTN